MDIEKVKRKIAALEICQVREEYQSPGYWYIQRKIEALKRDLERVHNPSQAQLTDFKQKRLEAEESV